MEIQKLERFIEKLLPFEQVEYYDEVMKNLQTIGVKSIHDLANVRNDGEDNRDLSAFNPVQIRKLLSAARARQFYDSRRVTRAQFTAFTDNPTSVDRYTSAVIHNVPEEQRKALLEVGKAVCRISTKKDNKLTFLGTGFHLGYGYIMTNEHVICDNEDDPPACCATFDFPEVQVRETKPRMVLFSYFNDPEGTLPVDDSRKDLALIYVPEIIEKGVPHLNKIPPRPAEKGRVVYLIHYGDGVDEDDNGQIPQQFSVSDNQVSLSVTNNSGNTYTVHTAHCRPYSSGAPLITFDEDYKGFRIVGVHFAGPVPGDLIIDSPGYALWFNGENWLQNTIKVVSDSSRMYRKLSTCSDVSYRNEHWDKCKSVCESLQEYLRKYSLRLVIPRNPPACGLDLANFTDIIWIHSGN